MNRRQYLIILSLIMAMAVLPWGVDLGRADSETTTQSPAKTGPFRDPESVPKLRSITNAQREEAARRAAEFRAEAARAAALGNVTTSKPVSPGKEKGGAK